VVQPEAGVPASESTATQGEFLESMENWALRRLRRYVSRTQTCCRWMRDEWTRWIYSLRLEILVVSSTCFARRGI
jgi:hypothetical protein